MGAPHILSVHAHCLTNQHRSWDVDTAVTGKACYVLSTHFPAQEDLDRMLRERQEKKAQLKAKAERDLAELNESIEKRRVEAEKRSRGRTHTSVGGLETMTV